ncbi:hypothetical protein V498_08128, partial [Pseudogymnoascus sp. VKM F-4517 (FW-2822)]
LWEIGYLVPDDSRGRSLAAEPWWVVVAAVTYAESAWFNVPPAVAIVIGAVLGLCCLGLDGGKMESRKQNVLVGVEGELAHPNLQDGKKISLEFYRVVDIHFGSFVFRDELLCCSDESSPEDGEHPSIFRKRELNLCVGEIQNETAESAGQTARKEIRHSMVRWIRSVQTTTNSGYTIEDLMVRFLQSSGTVPFLLLTDKLRASEFEISELHKKNEALTTILHKCRSSDGNGGTEGGDMAGSDIHVSVSPTGPAKKRGKFE